MSSYNTFVCQIIWTGEMAEPDHSLPSMFGCEENAALVQAPLSFELCKTQPGLVADDLTSLQLPGLASQQVLG